MRTFVRLRSPFLPQAHAAFPPLWLLTLLAAIYPPNGQAGGSEGARDGQPGAAGGHDRPRRAGSAAQAGLGRRERRAADSRGGSISARTRGSVRKRTTGVSAMKAHYDFSKLKPRKNPYAKLLKRSVAIRLDRETVEYFKALAAQTGLPYQSLINLYLRDCAMHRKRLSLQWSPAGRRTTA
jgi:uncharacterized protein (DUF4415 family)